MKIITSFTEEDCRPHSSVYNDTDVTVTCVWLSVEDDDPAVWVDSEDPGQTGYPPEVWYGWRQCIYKWSWPDYPDPKALKKTLKSKKFRKLAEAAAEELNCSMDYSRGHWICRWRNDTPNLDKVVGMLEKVPTITFEGVWSADDWLQDCYPNSPECIGLSADTTDEEIKRIADRIYEEALGVDNGYVVEGLHDFLEKWRNELRAEEA